ncbi:MAG: SUMF1/EgtB/PvdO family nonheme iron enzyme, partial [Sedimentisphaerales bacterium]|nr:SUMF1/EgtB/PvdO family nonheme iron enzyme [Sedimentisphaerales bacterium]
MFFNYLYGKCLGSIMNVKLKTKAMTLCVTAAVLAMTGAALGVEIETVTVGYTCNLPDSTGYGAMDYKYDIGIYEVTAGQYTEFLNAVAATDTYGLYNPAMWTDEDGCKIQRSGSSGSYSYSVAAEWANRPVNFVCWGDAARFANWL